MSITKQQCRRVAQLLYPELWQTDPLQAVAKAIEFLHEAAESPTDQLQPPQPAAIIKVLAEHMKRNQVGINMVARGLGVSPYTVRTWLEGKYKPNEENSIKLENFIAQGS
jgi:hypothetical protein